MRDERANDAWLNAWTCDWKKPSYELCVKCSLSVVQDKLHCIYRYFMFLIDTRTSVFSYFPFIEDLFCILFSVLVPWTVGPFLSTRGNKVASIFLNRLWLNHFTRRAKDKQPGGRMYIQNFIHGIVSVESFFFLFYANDSLNYTQRKVTELMRNYIYIYF